MGRRKIQNTPIMKNRRRKIQNTWEKNEEAREITPWVDLPQEILWLILEKLMYLADIYRFLAVCKNWRIDILEDKDHRNLPWLCNISWSDHSSPRLECEIYDPYSRQSFKTSKYVQGVRYTRNYSNKVEIIGSKERWLIGTHYHHFSNKSEIFMYNPYSKEFIPLPFTLYEPRFATFSGNPTSQNCSVFVFLRHRVGYGYPRYENYISSYALNEDKKEWRVEFVDTKQTECCGLEYMNEQLWCLFKDGIIRRYNLADGSYTQVAERNQRLAAVGNQRLWLAKGDGALLMACKLDIGTSECSTFYFDQSNMSWVVGSDVQETMALFISGGRYGAGVPAFIRLVKDNDDLENKDCKVYFFHERLGKNHPSYYAFTQTRKQQVKYYYCTVFIEPPRINY